MIQMSILLHFFRTLVHYIHTPAFPLPCGGSILHIYSVWVVYSSVPSPSSTKIRTISNIHTHVCNIECDRQYTVLESDNGPQTFVTINFELKKTFFGDTPPLKICIFFFLFFFGGNSKNKRKNLKFFIVSKK